MSTQAWLGNQLDVQTLKRIEDAVRNAETTTQGEIVPMIVRSSSINGQRHLVVFLALMCLVFATNVLSALPHHLGPTLGLIFDLLLLIFIFILSLVASRSPPFQRLLLSPHDQHLLVQMRAELEFYRAGLQKTDGSTGVLIFLSWLERRAVILADKGIADKLPPTVWDDVVTGLTSDFKEGNFEKGMTQAIVRVGQILSEHFPSRASNPNELQNSLVIKE